MTAARNITNAILVNSDGWKSKTPRSYLLLAPNAYAVNKTPLNKIVEEIINTLLNKKILLIDTYVNKKNTVSPKSVNVICLTSTFCMSRPISFVILNKVNHEITQKIKYWKIT